eukprot:772177-Amphidinium_carterae.2
MEHVGTLARVAETWRDRTSCRTSMPISQSMRTVCTMPRVLEGGLEHHIPPKNQIDGVQTDRSWSRSPSRARSGYLMPQGPANHRDSVEERRREPMLGKSRGPRTRRAGQAKGGPSQSRERRRETRQGVQRGAETKFFELTEEIASICRRHTIRLNPHRAGAAASQHIPRSTLLGAYTTQGQGVSRATEHQWTKDVLRVVLQLARLRPHELSPGDFVSVNLNQNPRLPAHRDRNNLSETWLATCGQHTGGSLWIEALDHEVEANRDALRPLPKSLQGGAPNGLVGFVLPLHGTWTSFSGLRWHAVLPAHGERYSVSLFSPRHLHRLSESHWQLLAELGFQTRNLKRLAETMKRGHPEPDPLGAEHAGALDGPPLDAATQSSSALPVVPEKSSEEMPCARVKQKQKKRPSATQGGASVSRPPDGPSENCCLVLTRRLRCQGGSSFCFFVAEVTKLCRFQCQDTSQCRPALSLAMESFLPWGCPFPDVWSGMMHTPASRRRRQRWQREHNYLELVNMTVLFLNWMHANSRFDWPLVARSAQWCSEKQMQLMAPLMADLKAWCRSDVPLPSDGGLPSLLASYGSGP